MPGLIQRSMTAPKVKTTASTTQTSSSTTASALTYLANTPARHSIALPHGYQVHIPLNVFSFQTHDLNSLWESVFLKAKIVTPSSQFLHGSL